MSGGLAPSKSTVYLSNFDYKLTNNDIHQLLAKFGKIAKVTIVRDKVSHESKGLAFILFVKREDAQACAKAMNNQKLNERTIKASIAIDNGRAREFIRKKRYANKDVCYECGQTGHMSYKCPKNQLGDREKPLKEDKRSKKKRKRDDSDGDDDEDNPRYSNTNLSNFRKVTSFDDNEEEEEGGGEESSRPVYTNPQTETEPEPEPSSPSGTNDESADSKKNVRKPMKAGYFSDEDASD